MDTKATPGGTLVPPATCRNIRYSGRSTGNPHDLTPGECPACDAGRNDCAPVLSPPGTDKAPPARTTWWEASTVIGGVYVKTNTTSSLRSVMSMAGGLAIAKARTDRWGEAWVRVRREDETRVRFTVYAPPVPCEVCS